MLERLTSLQPLVGILPDQLLNKIHSLLRQILRIYNSLRLDIDYPLHGLLSAHVVEGSLACQELEGQHSEAP